jgi:hypothetical protein
MREATDIQVRAWLGEIFRIAQTMIAQLDQGIHENPGMLAVIGNPPEYRWPRTEMRMGPVIGKLEPGTKIKYRRTLDRQGFYLHESESKQTRISLALTIAEEKVVVLWNPRSPLWQDS